MTLCIEKANIRKDAQQSIEIVRQQARAQAEEDLTAEGVRIRDENKRIKRDLAFHERETDTLRNDNHSLKIKVKQLQRFRELAEQFETESGKRALALNAKIKDATKKGNRLKRSLTAVTKDFEKKQAVLEATSREEITSLAHENTQLRVQMRLQGDELRKIRKFSAAMLNQRSDVEQFFLEALEQVRDEIREQRRAQFEIDQKEHRRAMRELQRRGADLSLNNHIFPTKTFPQAAQADIERRRAAFGSPPRVPSDKVSVAQLTLEDRERVLRLLFSKMNRGNIPSKMTPRSHSLSRQSSSRSRSVSSTSRSAGRPTPLLPAMNPIPKLAISPTSIDTETDPKPEAGEATPKSEPILPPYKPGDTFVTEQEVETDAGEGEIQA